MIGPLVVITLRLLIPFSILRYPLLGGILCMLIDALDVVLITFINQGEFSNYHTTDKILDIYYLSFEAYKFFNYPNKLVRRTSTILFVYRVVGFVLFEFTKLRVLLFIFPNLFI